MCLFPEGHACRLEKMAGTLWRIFSYDIITIQTPLVRYGHHLRGKPPGIARTLKQRLEELNYKDPSLTQKVDIGFKQPKLPRKHELHKNLAAVRSNKELEKLARKRQLEVPLDEVTKEWKSTIGPLHIKTVAEHYGVYQDLFGDAYFIPCALLDIHYKNDDQSYFPVHRGNVVKPIEAAEAPEVLYEAGPNTLWTLILTNPDGHFTECDSEYVHWFVGNIPGNDISKGEVVWDYLQPFPARGTGFHRFVFVLYKQERKMDYSQLKQEKPCLQLQKRTFKTLEFYRERQDDLTPAGLAFFQSDWDSSLTNFYHNTLNMKEPVFEYDFPEPYIAPQRWFPLRQPFNLYMDKYRDPKQITKEYLLKKLKKRHPFQKPPPPPLFPNAVRLDPSIPSWLKLEIRKERLGWGRINDV